MTVRCVLRPMASGVLGAVLVFGTLLVPAGSASGQTTEVLGFARTRAEVVPAIRVGAVPPAIEPAVKSAAGRSAAGRPAAAPTVRMLRQDPATPDTPIRYLIEVRNPGRSSIPAAVVHQLLPPGLSYHAANPAPVATSAEQLRWTVSLAPGQTVRLRMRGFVSGEHTTVWNQVGLGAPPRLGTTACVAPSADSAVSGCDTALAEAVVVVPWWRGWQALAGYALILLLGAAAGIVCYRRRVVRHTGEWPVRL